MGRPVNKSFFGQEGIACKVKINSGAAVDGFIVKQTSTREFIVDVQGDQHSCVLVPKPAADLAIGEMSVDVMNAIGEIVQVEGFKGRVLTTSEGLQATWNTGNENTPKFIVAKVDAPLETATTVAPTTTANGSIGTLFRNGNYMFHGKTNPINKMQVATDGRIEIAVGPGFKGTSSGNPDSVSGTYTFQIEEGLTNSNGNLIKDDWNFRISLGLKQNPGNKKLTDLYDIKIVAEKDDAIIGTFTVVDRNDQLVIVSPYGVITDSYVGQYGDVLQNIQRLSFIDPSFVTGTYTLTTTATPKNGDPEVKSEFTVVANPPA